MSEHLGIIKNIADVLAKASFPEFSSMQLREFFDSPIWKAIELGVAQKLSASYGILKNPKMPMEIIREAQGAVMALEAFFTIRDMLMAPLKQEEIEAYREAARAQGVEFDEDEIVEPPVDVDATLAALEEEIRNERQGHRD